MIIANLIKKESLRRDFTVVTPDGIFEVSYNGEGLGYEEVIVNDEIACRKKNYLWYVPQFDFMIGNEKAQINIKVSFSMKVKFFNLIVDETILYEEKN